MGYTPKEVGEMSFWEFTACADGYARAHGVVDIVPPPTDEEFLRWVNGER